VINRNKKTQSRRDFLGNSVKIAGGCACAGALAALLVSCEYDVTKPEQMTGKTIALDISKEPKPNYLKIVGYGVLKTFKEDQDGNPVTVNYGIPVIVIRIAENQFACFSSLCTHQSCFGYDMGMPFGDKDGLRDIVCNCHGSRFNPFDGGKPVNGPAEKPLRHFETEYDPDTQILKINF
jgi:Rieske Fe-S protein